MCVCTRRRVPKKSCRRDRDCPQPRMTVASPASGCLVLPFLLLLATASSCRSSSTVDTACTTIYVGQAIVPRIYAQHVPITWYCLPGGMRHTAQNCILLRPQKQEQLCTPSPNSPILLIPWYPRYLTSALLGIVLGDIHCAFFGPCSSLNLSGQYSNRRPYPRIPHYPH